MEENAGRAESPSAFEPFDRSASHRARVSSHEEGARLPFGAVGRVIDRAVLSRVAEATLKDFLDRVADTIQMTSREASRPAELGRAGVRLNEAG